MPVTPQRSKPASRPNPRPEPLEASKINSLAAVILSNPLEAVILSHPLTAVILSEAFFSGAEGPAFALRLLHR
jgi:hypothetical protein